MVCKQEQHDKRQQRAKEGILALSDVEEMSVAFKMLSEPTRLRIVLALMQGELCVYHIAEACEGTVSAVSHQLRVLKDNKIVKARRFGKNVEYSIADEHVRKIVEMGIEHLQCAEA